MPLGYASKTIYMEDYIDRNFDNLDEYETFSNWEVSSNHITDLRLAILLLSLFGIFFSLVTVTIIQNYTNHNLTLVQVSLLLVVSIFILVVQCFYRKRFYVVSNHGICKFHGSFLLLCRRNYNCYYMEEDKNLYDSSRFIFDSISFCDVTNVEDYNNKTILETDVTVRKPLFYKNPYFRFNDNHRHKEIIIKDGDVAEKARDIVIANKI